MRSSDKGNRNSEKLKNERDFFKTIAQTVPAVVFINEIESSGPVLSLRNSWMNQPGLDFFGQTQHEMTVKGHDFFKEIIHPDDLVVVCSNIEAICNQDLHFTKTAMFRVKGKGREEYSWIYCLYVLMDSSGNNYPKKILCTAFEISDTIQDENRLVILLKEINRLKHQLKQCHFTRREKEVLALIVRGKTDRDIAKELCISIVTAKKHRNNLIRKASVKNSAELVALAVESQDF